MGIVLCGFPLKYGFIIVQAHMYRYMYIIMRELMLGQALGWFSLQFVGLVVEDDRF